MRVTAIFADPVVNLLIEPTKLTEFADKFVSGRRHLNLVREDISVIEQLVLQVVTIDSLEDKEEFSNNRIFINIAVGRRKS